MRKAILPVGRRISPKLKHGLYNLYRQLTTVHKPDGLPNVLLFTMPRSGSTWLTELIWSQPGFKCVNEPFDMRLPDVQQALGLKTWSELQNDVNWGHIERYMQGYLAGRIHTMEVAPHVNKFYRSRTSRIVFKIIHTGENKIVRFKDTFGAKVVYMTRHPLAVSLSRETYPRLESYLTSDFRSSFSLTQLKLAEKIIKTGNKLQQGVLDWCFQNALPLRDIQEDWAVLSYEQLVLDPEPVIGYLAKKLALPDEALMYKQLAEASGVKHKSDPETKQLLAERDSEAKRLRLIRKWQDKVSESDIHDAFAIMDAFGIDAYQFGSLLPKKSLWVGSSYDAIDSQLESRNSRLVNSPSSSAASENPATHTVQSCAAS